MWIKKIKLKNYRPYRNVEVNFQSPEENNFNIIQGTNGAGKTTFLNAITWCLHGKEPSIDTNKLLLNNIKKTELKPGEIAEVKVRIKFNNLEIVRKARFKKGEEGGVMRIPPENRIYRDLDGKTSELKAFETTPRGDKEIKNPELIIDQKIPKDLRKYFFFDGEKLKEYFEEEDRKEIKKAILDISQISLFDEIIRRIDKTKRSKIDSKLKKLSSDVEEIINEIEEKIEEKERKEEKLKEKENKKKEIKKKIKEINNELKESLDKLEPGDVDNLQTERMKLEEELNRKNDKLNELKEQKNEFLCKKAPFIRLHNCTKKIKEKINEKKEAGDLPPKYKESFLRELIEEKECICGADLNKENRLDNLKKKLSKKNKISNISEELSALKPELRQIIEDNQEFIKKRKEITGKIKDLKRNMSEKEDRIERIENKIKGIDQKQIKALSKQREKLQDKKSTIQKRIGRIEGGIENLDDKIKELKKKKSKELKSQKKQRETRNQLNFAEKALNAAKEIKSEVMREVREKVERNTERQFMELMWKEHAYKKVEISKNYSISVKNSRGEEAIGVLSAGEKQALALSFMAALNKVSGFEAPVIIDTLFGRLDDEIRNSIASNLSEYLSGRQIIMLVTGTEYTNNVRKRLSEAVATEYKIDYKEFEGKGEKAKIINM